MQTATAAAQTQLIPVPDLSGATLAEAQRKLEAARLTLGKQSDGIGTGALGTVMAQEPQAQTLVRRGSSVNVVLIRQNPSRDDVQRPVIVPPLLGKQVREAASDLRKAGLQVGNREMADAEGQRRGTVIGQWPGPGTPVPWNSRVNITVVDRQMVRVPNLNDRTLSEAEQLLRGTGLAVGITRSLESTTQEAGRVMQQDPQPGVLIPVASAVNLDLATAPQPAVVPNLRGHSVRDAVAWLEKSALALGLTTEAPTENFAPGTIVSQNPEAGERVPRGTRVDVAIAGAIPRVRVPSVVGFPQAAAEQALEDARLRIGAVSEVVHEAEAGTVLAQEPKAEFLLTVGSPVNLVVSSGRVLLVALHAEPPAPAPDKPVKFLGTVDPPLPHASYQFFFGDGLASDWLQAPETEHQYKTSAVYQAHLVVRAGGREYISAPVELAVLGTYEVTLLADKLAPDEGGEVLFAAHVTPAFPAVEFKFVFGDGSETEWMGSETVRHVYETPGSHEVYVVARVGRGQLVSSPRLSLRVGSIVQPWALIGVVIAVLTGLGIWIWLSRTPPTIEQPPETSEDIGPADVVLIPKLDAGQQGISQASPHSVGAAVTIHAVAEPGTQTVEIDDEKPELRKAAHE